MQVSAIVAVVVAGEEPQGAQLEGDDRRDGGAKQMRSVQNQAIAPQADDEVHRPVQAKGLAGVEGQDPLAQALAHLEVRWGMEGGEAVTATAQHLEATPEVAPLLFSRCEGSKVQDRQNPGQGLPAMPLNLHPPPRIKGRCMVCICSENVPPTAAHHSCVNRHTHDLQRQPFAHQALMAGIFHDDKQALLPPEEVHHRSKLLLQLLPDLLEDHDTATRTMSS